MKTLDDFKKDAGEDLSKKIIESLRDLATDSLTKISPVSDQQIIDWFYTPILALDNQSPYELCKKGEHIIVENLLNEYQSGLVP